MNLQEEIATENIKWPVPRKIIFLFIFFYSFFFIFPNPLNDVPYIKNVVDYYSKLMDAVNIFIGHHLLHIPAVTNIEDNGSGDRISDYVKLFTGTILAILLTIITFTINRKKDNFEKLFYLFYVSVRFYLGLYMLLYGFGKVFKCQFYFPALGVLDQHYGTASPMGLLWNFMGYSKPYTNFAGWGEVIAGVLLIANKRTVTIGALLTLIIMSNVVALNFCYDVCVKIFSVHLVLFSLFLIAPNFKNLYSFLILHKSAMLKSFAMPFKAKWLKATRVILKVVAFGIAIYFGCHCYDRMMKYADGAPRPPMYGAYKTSLFVCNHDTLKPLTTDTTRWAEYTIEMNYGARIIRMNEKMERAWLDIDTTKRLMDITVGDDTVPRNHFKYTFKNDTLVMRGNWNKDTLYVKLKKVNLSDYLLLNRGFHWVSEAPFHR